MVTGTKFIDTEKTLDSKVEQVVANFEKLVQDTVLNIETAPVKTENGRIYDDIRTDTWKQAGKLLRKIAEEIGR
jgi:hypothetical protein